MHESVGRVQFVVFAKFISAYLFQIAREKSCDYLLITYTWQFLSRFTIWRDKWNSFTISKSCMKTEKFPFTVKSIVYSQLNWRTWPPSKGKTPCSFDAVFLSTVLRVVEKLCERNYWTLTKILTAEKRS